MTDKEAHEETGVKAEEGSETSAIGHFRAHTVASQILIGSLTSFCVIGSFNALLGLGGAGQARPYIANAATSLNFGLLGVVCTLGGLVVSRLGLKWTMCIGTLGDPLFGAAVYCSTRYNLTWFFLFASVIRGICSGLFWAAEGSLIIGYPRAQHRGRAITTWVFFKELGGIISSSINLALSAHDNRGGHFDYSVYYVTIAVMCAGLPVALLLSPTKKVRHNDGTPVDISHPCTWKEELGRFKSLIFRKSVLSILPFAFYAYFYYSLAHTYNVQHFSVRGRSLVALLTQISSVLGSGFITIALEWRPLRSPRILTLFVLITNAASWGCFAWAAIKPPQTRLDWADPGFAKYAMPVVLIFMAQQSAQTYLYMRASGLSATIQDRYHLAGVIRGIESLGQCVAYGISASHASPIVSVAVSLSLYLAGSLGIFYTLKCGKGLAKEE